MKLVPCPISESELRTLYLEAKLTDSEIAEKVGCPLKHIRRWRHRWGIETICRTERHDVPTIEGRLRSILVGSMLGDGRLSKSTHVARYMENHADDQKEYLEWKIKEWGSWVQLGLRPVTWAIQDEEYDGWRFETVSHATMLPWHELFYPEPGPKQLQPQVVDLVDSLALAIWFMDDGSAAWWPLLTFGMKSGSHEVAQSILQKFSLNPRWAPGKGDTGQFIFEGEDQAHLFISLVKPHMPEFMQYKLNFGFQGPHYQVRKKAPKEALREMASQGVPIRRMAKITGIGATTIDRHLKKHGIEHERTVGRPPRDKDR
jgi:hypothetical protein